jgi:carbonic anhydrase/acetyltransferase-like protein (isoleucine patch superfamily)
MKQLGNLIDRIVERINVNLRDFHFDADAFVRRTIPLNRLGKFYAFYGITPQHPFHFHFFRSNLSGSYFLGRCTVDHAVVHKSDIRGDELKTKGDRFHFQGAEIPVYDDEMIRIKDACLIKTLVHCNTHDPENLEEFLIQNTVSMHYANIHGSPVQGCFIGPFATVDLTTLHDSIIGAFSYLQVGELSHQKIEPGTIWINAKDIFDFRYSFSSKVLKNYIFLEPGSLPRGIFIDFIRDRKTDFQKIFKVVNLKAPIAIPRGASLNRYAFVKGDSTISENVLVAQRAYLENAWLGKGANAQENCYIINSRLEGNNVTAHGGKIVNARLGKNVFVGFNSFLRATSEFALEIGEGSIVMPHTIIDLDGPLTIPEDHVVWGYIRNAEDLKNNAVSIKKFSRVKKSLTMGAMKFEGSGFRFIEAFKHRIEHILEANGAFFDGRQNRGHAQMGQDISFNIIQPYGKGAKKGLYPTIDIRP